MQFLVFLYNIIDNNRETKKREKETKKERKRERSGKMEF